ncbi:MAG: helix-turn-helix domain-containing protein [Erythrobacter sp.]|nr:helix-turn-helix domain-containing protein [Erythrobacter sp.]
MTSVFMEQLIDELGGNTVLAKELNCTPNAVSNWRTRGIPWKLRPVIARMAAEKALKLPDGFWGAAS